MRRTYVDTSDFRSPLDAATLQGLGVYGSEILHFPKTGRSYYSIAHYRAPYAESYFQDNDLFGVPSLNELPPWACVAAGLVAGYFVAKAFTGK